MDGNNSLKRMARMADRSAADTRVLSDSSYFVSREFVDQYAHEVQGRGVKGPAVRQRGDTDADEQSDTDTQDTPIQGDPTDGLQQEEKTADVDSNLAANLQSKTLAHCVDNWKSAAKEESKRMWSIFDETGIFASACRHGLVLWIIDMVKSGEL